MESTRIAIAHDYLTQRGGAERVVLAMARTFPGSPILTSLYARDRTFLDFANLEVRSSALKHVPGLAEHHRLGLPLYAPAFSAMRSPAQLTICSTSGWAHAISCAGAKLLYVHNTARWLYQSEDYFRDLHPHLRQFAQRALAPLTQWDRRHGRSATKVLANSEAVRQRIREHWGADAKVLYPPHGADINAPQRAVPGIAPGYLLTVARLLSYKRVDILVRAMRELPQHRLVVVGTGPRLAELRSIGASNAIFLEEVSDAELRWLYANAATLVSAASEDLGLAPLEAMAFGQPVAVLRAGGFKETVLEGVTGTFFERPEPEAVRHAVERIFARAWDRGTIAAHASRFDERSFSARLRAIASVILEDGRSAAQPRACSQ